jgi:hypothetical protein
VDKDKVLIMPRNIAAVDFHYSHTHQSRSGKTAKYKRLLGELLRASTNLAYEDSAEQRTRAENVIANTLEKITAIWDEITKGVTVASPRKSPRLDITSITSSSSSSRPIKPLLTVARIETLLAEEKELKRQRVVSEIKEHPVDDVIDMTGETTRVLIKGKRRKLSTDAWRNGNVAFDYEKQPRLTLTPDRRTPLNALLNAKLPTIPVFSWSRFGHVDIVGDGNCLFHCLTMGLRGMHNTTFAQELRTRVQKYINSNNGFSKCYVENNINQHLTIMMARHIVKEPRWENELLDRLGDVTDDRTLDQWRLLHHAVNFKTEDIQIPFFTKLIAKCVTETYAKQVGTWRRTASETGDDFIPLFVVAQLYDVGFAVWRNATLDADDDVKIKFMQFVYRTSENAGLHGFPVINILYSPKGSVYENCYLQIGHYSLLTDKQCYYSHYGADPILSRPAVAIHTWTPTKTVHDIMDQNDRQVLLMRKRVMLFQHSGNYAPWNRFWWLRCARRRITGLLKQHKDQLAKKLLELIIQVETNPDMALPSKPTFAPLPEA